MGNTVSFDRLQPDRLCPKNPNTAPTARDIKARASANGARYRSQGQARSASPLVMNQNSNPALKGRIRCVFRPFRPKPFVGVLPSGDALRFASRLPWLLYLAPLALSSTFEAKLTGEQEV